MFSITYTTQFKKDYKRVEKRNYKLSLLKTVVEQIVNNHPLPQRYHAHQLKGHYKDCWECHILPDWLLIWQVDEAENTITFVRTGTHADLF